MAEERERRGFDDLECYSLALQVVKQAYGLAGRLPDAEKYNLAAQVRRSAASTTLNIAEGYGRYHYLDSLRFYYIARGSLSETLSAFVTCEAIGYLTPDELVTLRNLVYSALRSLNGYIRYVHNARRGHKEYGTQLLREDQPIYRIDLEPPPDEE
jgi:four helix bundle protein